MERPDGLSTATPAQATKKAAAGDPYGTENGSHTAGPSILNALSSATQVAFPVRSGQDIGLGLDHASLYLTENGFAFLQAHADLFWRNRRPFHLGNQVAFQNAAIQTRLDPNSELHHSPPYP
jgi:hypothetical protein